MKCRIIALSFLVAGCTSVPPGPPAAVASDITAYLDEGDRVSADFLFREVAGQEGYPEKMYPVLFEAARTRYEAGDAQGSSRVLLFMAEGYPDARAVRESLVYSLFLERAAQDPPDPVLLDEIEEAVGVLRDRGGRASVWVDLVEAQVAIDRDRLPEARASFGRFLADWDGSPPALMVYVEDVDRYLRSH